MYGTNKNVTATGLAVTGPVVLTGIIVSSHTSGTIKLNDSILGATQNLVMNTYTFPAGSGIYTFPKPLKFENGIYATVGGTLDCQLILA